MDVRCEKCQTEYELDESRLKPGGVTVKCTHCGHLFKIRDDAAQQGAPPAMLAQPPSPSPKDADSMLAPPTSVPTGERMWLIRLENGEERTCRELSALQEWIATGVAGREALISRSGKTWKRLGGIVELESYFAIADQARARAAQTAEASSTKTATLRGVASPPVGGPAVPENRRDDSRAKSPSPLAQTELSLEATQRAAEPAKVQPETTASAAWGNAGIKGSESMAAMPQGPRSGRVALQDREPAFANRARIEPGRMPHYDDDDDDDFLPSVRGSRAGMWIALFSLFAIAGAAAVYLLKFRGQTETAPPAAADAAVVPRDAVATIDASTAGPVDAPAPDSLASARAELYTGVESRMKTAYDALADKADATSLAMRARLGTSMAQAAFDRSDLAIDRAEGEKLRKEAKQLVIDAAALAERSRQMTADDPSTSLALADVLRLQAKPANDVQRYLEAAKTKGTGNDDLARSIALSHARLLMRDGKLDDAQKVLAAIDKAGDHRIGLTLALIAYGQNKPADAKPLLAAVVEANPDHPVAAALQKRIDTMGTNTDPLPPEGAGSIKRPPAGGAGGAGGAAGAGGANAGGAAGDYDTLVAKAKSLAATNCAKAMELYTKALEQSVTGVEALTGMGYCFLNAKQYASAFSKFRSALAVSSRYEPALAGVAETYQQQGNRDQEIEAWRKYLEVFPNAQKAKRRLEALGATSGAGSAGAGTSGGSSGAGAGEPGATGDTPQPPTPLPPTPPPPTGSSPESPSPQ